MSSGALRSVVVQRWLNARWTEVCEAGNMRWTEFLLLGGVEVRTDGTRLPLGPAQSGKALSILAVLLRTPGVPVSADALTERVWGERPTGPATRYKYIGWLRSALAPCGVPLRHGPAGYVLDVAPEQVDLHRFRAMAADAREAHRRGRLGEATRLLDAGMSLWRGPALADLSGSWIDLYRAQLNQERRDAAVQRAKAALALRCPTEILVRLAEWETEWPTDEAIISLRMLALYRCGQLGSALSCYRRAESRIRAILGTASSSSLRTLHDRIRAQDPLLTACSAFTDAGGLA